MAEFDKEIQELVSDIDHIGSRLEIINNNIMLLQSNVDRLTTLLLNNQTQDKFKLYDIQNKLMITLASYNDNYEKLLSLRFKYRSEKDDFSLKIAKFYEIELRKVNDSLESADVDYKQVMKSLSMINEKELDFDEFERV